MNNKSKIIIASIVSLGVITGRIMLSSNGNTQEVRRETVIIEEGYGSNKVKNENKGEIKIEEIKEIPRNCIGWLDDENILVLESNYKRECFIRKYNIKSGQYDVTYKPGIEGHNASLSPDKSKIFIWDYDSRDPEIGQWGNDEYLNYMYDLKSNTTTKVNSSGMFGMWSEDSSVVYLCKRQTFKESENTYTMRKVGNEFYDVDYDKIFKSENLDKLTTDRSDNDNYMYDIYLIKDKSNYLIRTIDVDNPQNVHEYANYEVDNESKDGTRKIIDGKISESVILDDNHILFSGYNFYNQGKYESGIYLYDEEKNKVTKLLSTFSFNMSLNISDNKKYIAFDQKHDTYIARIEDNEIKDKTLALKGDNSIKKFFFSPDNKKLIIKTGKYKGKSYIVYLED